MDEAMNVFRKWHDRVEAGRTCFQMTRSSGCWAGHMTWLVLMPAMTAMGQQVFFDVVPLVACRDVTTDEFSRFNPDESLWEARFQVSSLVAQGVSRPPDQYLVRVESMGGGTVFVDFAPKTATATAVVGNIKVEDLRENKAGDTASLHVDFQGVAKLDAGGRQDTSRTANRRYETLPPQELVTASGTTRGGRGVYFKARGTSQGTLEGARDLQVTLRTPRSWRGERLFVYCYAWTEDGPEKKGGPLASQQTAFSVALYPAGDGQAKLAARDFLLRETRVRELAGSAPPPTNPWKAVWSQIRGEDDLQPRRDWLQQTVLRPQAAPHSDFFATLPAPLQQAIRDYAASDEAYRNLSLKTPFVAAHDPTNGELALEGT